MFFFFSNGFGLVGSIIVSIAVTLLLLYACSGPYSDPGSLQSLQNSHGSSR